MNTHYLYIFPLLLTLYQSQALKCRSGNQKLSDDIRKVMQKCKRNSESNRFGSDDSSDENSESDSSDSDIFDEDFFNLKKEDSNNNNNNKNKDKDSRDGNSDRGNRDQNEQSCVTQCFFDELRLTNRQGFPERAAVTKMMLQGIHDPMVRDFIEQSIIDCFHFVYGLHLDKCTFSHNLLTCFTDKGRERCDDWND
ncbi:general odorant-binding protein 71 [Microplitis demolitor]|uniref:general odorant-binding protein 71 n=1 Tax=Microplitis demolitor TaxID=69319 RepID=UPI00235B670D|nr:general odorant-binding protein 71 [Microplitis demolitor]